MRKLLSPCLPTLAALFCACTASIDLRYVPQHPASYVPGSDKVALFVAPVDDPSGHVQFSAYNSGVIKFQYPRPMAEGVREALTIEAKRGGFPVVSAERQADAVLRAALTSVQIVVSDVTNLDMATDVKILLDLSLEDRVTRRRVWANSVEGWARITRTGGYDPTAFGPLLNQALAEAMAKFGSVLAQADLSKLGGGVAAVAAAPDAQAPVGADVDDVPPAGKPKPKAYAVVIGVGHYRKGVPPAEFADADARLVAKYLAAGGVSDSNIATLVDDEAGRADFEKYFEKWLPNHVQPGSDVTVYYSGHGAPDPKTGQSYLVPFDGDPVYLEETAYPVKRLYAQLAKLPAAKVTVILDSCFSGAGGRSVIAAGARPLVTVAQPELPAKLTVISASAGEQISNSYREKGHGLFTYYFLKGLREKGDDLRAVYAYLKPEVSGYARRELNADQDPQWREGR